MHYLERQRELRKSTNYKASKKYEKTFKGFLMRCYRNMKSRVTGIQKKKSHLYLGKELLSKEDFYNFSINNADYKRLFDIWILSDYNKKLTPSIDRIESSKGYTLDNIRWITFLENSTLGSISRWKKEKELISN